MKYVKSLQVDKYKIVYTHEHLYIGCEKHLIKDWWGFDVKTILAMDGKEGAVWWKKWKPILQEIIKESPAIKPELEEVE